jgi:flavorubredoxin
MQSTVTEIASDIYRVSTFRSDYGIQFNQFLIKDAEPCLIHTGFKTMFQATLEAISAIIDPKTLRWIGFSHFESDECGALNEWLKIAPRSQAVCSVVGAMVMIDDFADRKPLPLADDEVLATGRHRLRFLATPHVPHCWDAGLFFDDLEQTLFCSDLFFHPGNPEPLVNSDIVGRAADAIQSNLAGPMAKDMPYTPYTTRTLERLADLQPKTLAVMHGSSFHGIGQQAIVNLSEVITDLLANPMDVA